VGCALGPQRLVTGLPRGGLPRPTDVLVDETPRCGLPDTGDLPTMVGGRLLWPRGDAAEARAAAFTPSSQVCQRAAGHQEPTERVRGMLTAGFDSTTTSMRALFPGARLGNGLRHALNTLPTQLAASASPVRQALRSQVHTLRYRARPPKGLRVCALGQRLRHCADHVATTAGAANGPRVRPWVQDKHAGWYTGLAAPRRPVTST
jgi:hypothetical protein